MSISQAWVAERYRLIESLGSGGMGRVWLARDEVLRRDVAIKEVVPPEVLTEAEREELRMRTMREARAAARLNDPHVVRIYDVVHTEQRPWIVMEYVPSRSLHQVITEDGPLPVDRVAQIGLAVLGALRAAHEAGVLHRDVKPGNVLLADDGRVVLTDFGLAIFEGGDGAVTRPGLILGSPQYISPERARDGISGPEADLWSLGATLYAAVEGRSPYARSTTFGTLTALATEDPDPTHRAGLLKPVLNALLRKDPRARASVAEAERLLQRAANGEGRMWPWSLPRQRRPRESGQVVVPLPTAPAASGGAVAEINSLMSAPPVEFPGKARGSAAVPISAPPVDITPVSGAPVSSAPVSGVPVSAAPVSGVPVSSAPVSGVPVSAAPVSAAPVSAAPVSGAPVSGALVSSAPVSGVPVSAAPVSAAPVSGVPVSGAPVSAPSFNTPPLGTPAFTMPPLDRRDAGRVRHDGGDGPPVRGDVPPVRSPRWRWAVVAAAVIVALVVAALLTDSIRTRSASNDAAPKTSANARTPGASTGPTGKDTASASPSAGPTGSPDVQGRIGPDPIVLPVGYHYYTDPQYGWRIAVPDGWVITHDPNNPTMTYFDEPTTPKRRLGVDRSSTPKSDPVADWTALEKRRLGGSELPGYQRVKIEAVPYFEAAADWVYTYNGTAGRLQVCNRGFKVNDHLAHAIFWLTPAPQWKDNLSNWDLFTASFRPGS